MNDPGIKRVYKMHSDFLKALTHPRRLEILDLLRGREQSFAQLMQLTGMKKANLSQQLTFLREKGIVGERRENNSLILFILRNEVMEAYDIMHAVMAGNINEDARLSLEP